MSLVLTWQHCMFDPMVELKKPEEKILMDKLVLNIPTLFGDHHTTAVKQLLKASMALKVPM